jgi:parallel beta-helix repeat protein
VCLGLSDGNLIAHNYIHDVPHTGINLGTNGYGRNMVEYNEIRRYCLELPDNGAINSWMDRVDASRSPYILKDGERAGHIIRYNFIADGKDHGVYMDDWTSNCLLYGNIILRSGNGFMVNGGKNNVMENNIIAECGNGISYADVVDGRPSGRLMAGFLAGNRSRGNIFYTTGEVRDFPGGSQNMVEADKATLFMFTTRECIDTDRIIAECDYNLFFNATGKYAISGRPIASFEAAVWWARYPRMPKETSLEQWREMGLDANSLAADPLFVDPEHDDYRLQSDSPALELGFRPIDASRIGIRKQS